MDASETSYPPGDPRLIDKIVYQLKSQGIFDQFRKECMADVDTKPAYQNLHQRVEASVSTFLSGVEWRPDLSKNQLRENLRKHVNESGFLEIGVERIVDQVVNPKIRTVFLPHVEEVVYSFLGLERPRQARPATNSSPPKPQENVFPPKEETIPPEQKKGIILSDILPNDLDPVSPDSDTCELNLKHDDEEANMEFLDGEAKHKDKKPEEDTSPAFEPLLDENSNGSHMSGMSGFSSHDEGLVSPMQQGASSVSITQDVSQADHIEKMEVETSCKSESESGADKVTSTVEENVPSPSQALVLDMSILDIQEQSCDKLMETKDEKCDSSMDSFRVDKDKDNDKEKDSRKKERLDSRSSKSRSDAKDKHKSSDKSKHDSKDKKTEKDKPKHEENRSRSKSETRKDKDIGSKKDKVSDVKKDKTSETKKDSESKKDKKIESSKNEHREGGSRKEKDAGSRKEKEHESKRDRDSDKKQDKNGDKKKESDKDKSKSDDRSKSKHDDKTKDRSKGDTKHGSKEGKDKSQNKDDKYAKSTDKKSKSIGDQKSRDGEKKDSKEKSSSSTHKHSSDQKTVDESDKKDKTKKGKSSAHASHGDDKHSVDGENLKSPDKSKKGRSRTKTPDDVQSTDGESDARSRDSFIKSKEGPGKRLDDLVSSDAESDHMSRDSDKSSKHKTPEKQRGNESHSENGGGGSSSKDDGKKRKERKSKKGQDDHHMHHSRRDHDRRSADRDSSGSAPPSGGSRTQRQGRSGQQESSPRKSSKASDTNSSATDATDATDSMQLQLNDSFSGEAQDNEASPTSSLPFKKRPLLQDAESENNVNNNLHAHDKTALHCSDSQDKTVCGEDASTAVVPKQVERQKLGEIEKSLRSEVDDSLANSVPSFEGKLNGMLRHRYEDEESDVRYFKFGDDSIFDDRDRQYMKALQKVDDSDFTNSENERTLCAISHSFDGFVKTAGELGIKVVQTLQGIEVYNIGEEQESTNSSKDTLKNRRYSARLSDDLKGANDNEAPSQQQAEVIDLSSDETLLSVDQNTNSDYASLDLDDSVGEAAAYRSTSDEDTNYGMPLSSDLILPSLQDLMRESGMVQASAPNASSQAGSCRRVGLPRPNRKSDSGDSSRGASFDKKNGMSNDRQLLRSSLDDSKRYSSEDLYKPRPLFSHGSRRNRHSEEQASHPVAVTTARPSQRNVTFGAHDKLPCSEPEPRGAEELRGALPSTPKASPESPPRELALHPRPPAPTTPNGQHPSGVSPPQSGVNSKPLPHVARCTTATAMPPPLAVFLSLPRIQSRLLACRSSRTGGTRAAR